MAAELTEPLVSRSRRSFRRLAIAAALAAAATGATDGAVRRVSLASAPTAIAGTVHVNGCAVAADQLRLRAEPFAFGAPDDVRAVAAKTIRRRLAVARSARFEATDDPHVFAFAVSGLRPETLYRLRIGAAADGCGRLFWRGPANGLAVVGGESIAIEGFAARTEVEVEDAEGDFVGADEFDLAALHDPDGVPQPYPRTFRWRSSLPGVTAGELQIAAEAFPTAGVFSPCGEAPGAVVFRQRLTAPAGDGEWVSVAVDLGGLLGDARTAASAEGAPALSPGARRLFLAGRPLYVRVVPLTGPEDAETPLCDAESDGVHGWAMLAPLPKEFAVDEPIPGPAPLVAGDDQRYLPPYRGGGAQGHPSYGELAYKVIEDHQLPGAVACKVDGLGGGLGWLFDPLGCTIVNAGWLPPGATIARGVWFHYTPPPSNSDGGGNILTDLTDSLGSLATGFYEVGGFAVDTLHDLAESVKSAVAAIVVDVIKAVPGIGDVCKSYPSQCESLVRTGLETGLTAMGVPPSIPNWEQLRDQGIEYLAAEIAAEVASTAGLPPDLVQEFTEEQVRQLAQQAIADMDARRGGADPRYSWVIPYLGFEPASWTLEIEKTTADPVPANLYLRRPQSYLWTGGDLHVPQTFPASGSLLVPMVLQPNLEAIPAPFCQTDIFGTVTCTPSASGTPRCTFMHYQNPQTGWVPAEYPCDMTNHAAIYYRDAWVQQRFGQVACAALVAATATDVAGLFLPAPAPLFAATWLVQPATPALGVVGGTYDACVP